MADGAAHQRTYGVAFAGCLAGAHHFAMEGDAVGAEHTLGDGAGYDTAHGLASRRTAALFIGAGTILDVVSVGGVRRLENMVAVAGDFHIAVGYAVTNLFTCGKAVFNAREESDFVGLTALGGCWRCRWSTACQFGTD